MALWLVWSIIYIAISSKVAVFSYTLCTTVHPKDPELRHQILKVWRGQSYPFPNLRASSKSQCEFTVLVWDFFSLVQRKKLNKAHFFPNPSPCCCCFLLAHSFGAAPLLRHIYVRPRRWKMIRAAKTVCIPPYILRMIVQSHRISNPYTYYCMGQP